MSYITCAMERGQPLVSLFTFPGAPSLAHHEIHAGLPILPQAGSSTHLQVLSRWISCCDKSHQCFPPQDIEFVPTRLLDVGSEGSPWIRLIEKLSGDDKPCRYIALSHRWGSPELHRALTTTTASVTQFRQGIRVAELPQTFRDAVQVTRGLGVRYLWIDSLCIIQDDPQDWGAESKLMEQVFSSAYVTISASCSSGTNDGFLKPRPDRTCITAKALDDGGSLYYLCDAIDDFHLDVEEGDLSKRAWVLQERALSRRTIYFSERQSYWECGQGVRCETLTKLKNQRASILGDANFPHSTDSFVKGMKIELYQGLYERFSNLQITFPSDRPVAIKGLETRLLRTFGTTGGFGIFDIYLHRFLLWQRSGGPLKRITVSHGPKVPSWSWMAYTGGIRYLEVPYGGALWESDVVSPFSDGDVDAGGPDEGDTAEAKVPGIKAVAWDLASDMAVLTTRGEREAGRVILDEPGSERTGAHNPDAELKCVVVGRSKQWLENEEQVHYVIVITAVTTPEGSAKVWERIGVGVLTRADISLEGPATDVMIQ
ncbi:hypothetical protein RB601_008411 [Gaeumannomyces tritici]